MESDDARPAASPRPSLLLVDDRPENLIALEAILSDFDLELVSCHTGQDALRQVLRQDFALILLDVHMPDMDGFEVASILRKRPKTAGIPIIFMTASTASELQMFQGYALGAVDYMWKPIVPGILRSKVMVFVELYLKRAEVRAQGQRLLELERARHEEHLGRILDAAGEGIFGIDASGAITFINPAGASLLGAAPDALLGKPAHALLHPDCDGSDCGLLRAFGAETARQGIDEQFWREGRPYPAEYICTPVREAGEPAGAVVTFQDVSGRRSLEAQLLQSQKMEAVGRLAGGVAHDFNNILTLIQGYGELLGTRLQDRPGETELLKVVLDASERAANLTRQLLLFSRKQLVQPKLIDPNERLQGLEQLLRRLIGEDIRLQTQLAEDPGTILIDPGHFDQILLNLAVNARDAMPRGGELILRSSRVTLEAPYLSLHHGLEPGTYLLLTISDTGIGMDAETLAHIFEPFYTTKGEGEGTGLGLATVYSIVRQHGGQVMVYSEPGKGTVFKVYFPLEDAPPDASAPPPEALASRGHETILVVEDEPAVRALICNVLSDSGYRVLEATQGRDALAICQELGQPPDLLLTDVIMPGISGAELGKALSELYPGLRILYMSGYTDDLLSRYGLADQSFTLLEKPFTPGTLLAKLREVLAG